MKVSSFHKHNFYIPWQPQKDYNKSSHVIPRVDSKSIFSFLFAAHLNSYKMFSYCHCMGGRGVERDKGKLCHLKVSLTVLYSHIKNKHLQNIIRQENCWREMYVKCVKYHEIAISARVTGNGLGSSLLQSFITVAILVAIKTFRINSWRHLLRF